MFWDDSLAIYREQAESAQLEAIKYNSPDIMHWHKSAATYYYLSSNKYYYIKTTHIHNYH